MAHIKVRLKGSLVILLAGCLVALGCHSSDPKTLNRLIQTLSAKEASERNRAALALAAYGGEGAPAVPALIRCLKDSNGGVRSSAAYALRSIGTKEANDALDRYHPQAQAKGSGSITHDYKVESGENRKTEEDEEEEKKRRLAEAERLNKKKSLANSGVRAAHRPRWRSLE